MNGMDLLELNRNMKFSTRDNDNDKAGHNCATSQNRGGFWYYNCGYFFPNGVWLDEADSYTLVANGWIGIRHHILSPYYTLNSTLFMIRPADL